MKKLTPKQNNAIDNIIRGGNFSLFVNFGKLLGVSTPLTNEEKLRLLVDIANKFGGKK